METSRSLKPVSNMRNPPDQTQLSYLGRFATTPFIGEGEPNVQSLPAPSMLIVSHEGLDIHTASVANPSGLKRRLHRTRLYSRLVIAAMLALAKKHSRIQPKTFFLTAMNQADQMTHNFFLLR